MTIEELLKNKNILDVRVTHGFQWLYWSEGCEEWVVVERLPFKKKNTTLYQGPCLDDALVMLTKGDDA